MGEATIACCYFVFALMFACFNILMQDVETRSQMRNSVVNRYIRMPFQFQPEYPYEGIAVPSELYEWMKQAFIPVTYSEHPQMGRSPDFCTQSYPCDIGQGVCSSANQCESGLVCRDQRTLSQGVMTNGKYWDKQELKDWCDFLGTPVDFSRDGSASPPEYQNCTASPSVESTLGPCCWDKQSNAYITSLINASVTSEFENTFNIQGRGNCPISISPDMDCCSKVASDPLTVTEVDELITEAAAANPRPVNVGNFNRVLLIRFSAKRFKKVGQKGNSAFANLSPYALSGDGDSLKVDSDNGEKEDKDGFDSYSEWHHAAYNWKKDGSFKHAGGYVETFTPSRGRNTLYILLQRLWLDGFFDKRLATFVIDMMFYNGQSGTFMHVVFYFVFHPGGSCTKSHETKFVNMDANTWTGKYLIGHILKVFLALFVLFFVVIEIRKAQDVGFGGLTSIVDSLSLILCTVALAMNFFISLSPVYNDFEFSSDPEYPINLDSFEDIVSLQALMVVQGHIVAVNLLMIFLRAVVMITSLDGTVGLIINTLGQSFISIIYFSLMFFFMMMGSVAFAFFTFGSNPRASGMSSPVMTFYVTFAMLMGQQDFDGLREADHVMVYPFFFAFYILVLFVMLNMFISILLSGYDICIQTVVKDEDGLFQRIYDEVRQDVLNKCIGKTKAVLGGFVFPCILGFLRGITSCFKDTMDSMVSGMTIPSSRQVGDSCCFFLKNNADPKDEFKRELKWAKELAKSGKAKVNRVRLESPTDADRIEEKVTDVVELVREEEKKMKDEGDDYKPTDEVVRTLRNSLVELDNLVMHTVEKASIPECCFMISFMMVFSAMLVIMARGENTYYSGKANMNFGADASWITTTPLRIFEYQEIDSMEHVGEWASVLIDVLYDRLGCRETSDATAVNFIQDCDPGSNEYAIVQEVKDWNIGFLNTTFLRASIQPGCYITNPESRWFYGARQLRSHVMRNDCLNRNCFNKALDEEGQCLTHSGVPFDPSRIETIDDALTPSYYNYSEAGKLGPFHLYSGIAVSFGRTKSDALDMLSKMDRDGWFSKRSASIMFDYITYNGNLDMFTHSMFGFSLLASGKVVVEKTSETFSLHIEDAGGTYHTWRVVVVILFAIYVTMVAYFVGITFYDLCRMRMKGKRLKHRFYYFVVAYYKNLWNRTDSLSLAITLLSLSFFVFFILDSFRTQYKFAINDNSKYQVPLVDAANFEMSAEVSSSRYLEDDWYVFHRFEDLGATYDVYLNLAAINAFFIAVKIVKYANAVQRFKHFASTLSDGAEQMLYFSIVILLLLFGWSLFFYFWFGVHVDGLEGVFSSVYRCFSWVLGEFAEDMDGMLKTSLVEALVAFILFQTMMYFICLNMFLATMLNTYCDTVGRTEVEREKRNLVENTQHDYFEVEYEDKDELKNDINIKKDELGEVWVVSINDADDAKAKKAGVTGGGPGIGNCIMKVNGDRHDWKDFPTEAEIFEEGINPDASGDDKIRLLFKAPRKKNRSWIDRYTRCCMPNREDDPERQTMKPTVKQFWRAHGAVSWITTQSQRNIEPDDVPDMDELEGVDPQKEDKQPMGSSGEERQRRAKLKQRLDMLLFSRAVKSKRAKQSDDDMVDSDANLNSADDGKLEDDLEIDQLRSRIEAEAVTGDEVWLDCLVTAIEHEMEEESYVTDVLRTSDMNEITKGQNHSKIDSVNNFYRLAFEILSILECKAKQKWYIKLQEESKERLDLLNKQNAILHDYSCELEESFVDLMQKINEFQGTKEQMVNQLAGLLDSTAYGDTSNGHSQDQRSRTHMTGLTIPWPESIASQGNSRGTDQASLEYA